VSFPWDSDRWRRHQASDYSEGKASENDSDDDHLTDELPRDSRWTRPIALLALTAFALLAVWLIWAEDNPSLGVILFIVGGGSALFIAGTARPAR
jgi:hypothetical protein